jgi:hypothetical protein
MDNEALVEIQKITSSTCNCVYGCGITQYEGAFGDERFQRFPSKAIQAGRSP